MPSVLYQITVLCFGASYALAFGLEFLHHFRPRPVFRLVAIGLVAAGLLAQTLFLAARGPQLASQYGCLLFLAWILAVFALVESLHHRRQPWSLFALPLVVGLVLLAALLGRPDEVDEWWLWSLGLIHGGLLLLAAVGVCVGFLASVMYLVQAQQLKAKVLPGRGLRLPSLERLESMHRHAMVLAFPLLTAGLLVGLGLMWQRADRLGGWGDARVLGFLALWLVFALLLALRFGFHLRGRSTALLTIAAFALLLATLVAEHTLGQGGGR